MGMGIRLQFGNGNGKEWERPYMGMGMTHLPMGKNPTDFCCCCYRLAVWLSSLYSSYNTAV